MLGKLLWMVHVLLVGISPSRGCVIESAMSEMAGSIFLCPNLAFRGSDASGGVRGDLRITVRAFPSGVPHPSSTPQPVGVPLDRAGISAERGTPPVSFGAPPDDQMLIAALEGSLSLSLSLSLWG